jgi:hypothetical protein
MERVEYTVLICALQLVSPLAASTSYVVVWVLTEGVTNPRKTGPFGGLEVRVAYESALRGRNKGPNRLCRGFLLALTCLKEISGLHVSRAHGPAR